MIDIFAQPELCIADITVAIPGNKIPAKEYSQIFRKKKINDRGDFVRADITETLTARPVLLLNGDFPDEAYRRRYIDRHFHNIPKGNYSYTVSFSNIKFSSKIQYSYEES